MKLPPLNIVLGFVTMPTADAESHEKTETPPYRKICCAEATGISDIAVCLTADGGTCRYALPFGYGFFCQHPGREEFTVNITGSAVRADGSLSAGYHSVSQSEGRTVLQGKNDSAMSSAG